MELIERKRAAQQTIDKYLNKPFTWGSYDCVQLVSFNLQCLGYDNPLSGLESYGTRRNALKAMKRFGVKSFAEHLEKLGFEPIPPAYALAGDIVGFPGEGSDGTGWLGLGISIGHDRALAFTGDVATYGNLSAATHAWRAPPVVRELV